MSAKFYTIITNDGAAKIAAAVASGGKIELSKAEISDTEYATLPKDLEKFGADEMKYSGLLRDVTQSGDEVKVVFEIPADKGGWHIRTIGIFTADGKLFALAKLSGYYKPSKSDGTASTLTYTFVIKTGVTDATVIITLPPEMATVTLAQVKALILEARKTDHPVGSYYHTDTNDNPATILGFGFWQRVNGRLLVGYDPGQAEFNQPGKTGGNKAHTLTENNLPPHRHKFPGDDQLLDRGGIGAAECIHIADNFSYDASSSHGRGRTYGTSSVGKADPITHLPPYRVTNIWVRTA